MKNLPSRDTIFERKLAQSASNGASWIWLDLAEDECASLLQCCSTITFEAASVMQKYTFKLDAITTRLQGFNESKRLAFGIFLLERSLPEFLQFQIDSDSVGGGELRAVLAQCWSALETGDRSWSDFVSVDSCEKVMPDSEEQSSLYTSAAIDAVNIACNMLEFLKTADAQPLIESVTARKDTVDLFIQNNTTVGGEEKDLEEQIASHPLMQDELRLLNEDLDLLHACVDARHAVFAIAVERTGQQNYRQIRLVPTERGQVHFRTKDK